MPKGDNDRLVAWIWRELGLLSALGRRRVLLANRSIGRLPPATVCMPCSSKTRSFLRADSTRSRALPNSESFFGGNTLACGIARTAIDLAAATVVKIGVKRGKGVDWVWIKTAGQPVNREYGKDKQQSHATNSTAHPSARNPVCPKVGMRPASRNAFAIARQGAGSSHRLGGCRRPTPLGIAGQHRRWQPENSQARAPSPVRTKGSPFLTTPQKAIHPIRPEFMRLAVIGEPVSNFTTAHADAVGRSSELAARLAPP